MWQSRSTPAVASLSRKASITDEAPPPGGGKPSSGRVIRIVNNLDHTVQVNFIYIHIYLQTYYISSIIVYLIIIKGKKLISFFFLFFTVSSALESSNVSTIRGSARGFGPSAQNERGQENVYCLRTRGSLQIQLITLT